MAKYIVIEDFEAPYMAKPDGVAKAMIFPKGTTFEAIQSPVDGKLITTIEGKKPTLKVGEIYVNVVEEKIKKIAENETMKWIYLGGAAILLWWFIYGREDKKKYDNTPAGF